MSRRLTVLVATPDSIPTLKAEAGQHGEVLAFSDAEALQALEAIARNRPRLVMLDREFAETSRGTAFLTRLREDPMLNETVIRLVSGATANGANPPPAATGSAGDQAPAVGYRTVRRAPRFKMSEGVEVVIDGKPVTLIDLSSLGAQVTSTTVLRPNQRVRMSIGRAGETLRVGGVVAWASFEKSKAAGTLQYRAGIALTDMDVAALDAFCNAHRA